MNLISTMKKLRYKLWKFIRWNIFRIKEGNTLPIIVIIIGGILFPSRGLLLLLHKINPIKYDIFSHTFTIYGMQYSAELFYQWSEHGWEEGAVFRLSRNNGCLCLEKITKK